MLKSDGLTGHHCLVAICIFCFILISCGHSFGQLPESDINHLLSWFLRKSVFFNLVAFWVLLSKLWYFFNFLLAWVFSLKLLVLATPFLILKQIQSTPFYVWLNDWIKILLFRTGMFKSTDRCCREHDHCLHTIPAYKTNYGVFNSKFFTLSHCDCDQRWA